MSDVHDHPDEALPPLPPRAGDGHKGTFGTVGVVGGQCSPPRVMAGGPAFTAEAALRAGAGLAVLAVPEPMMLHAIDLAPSATGLALPVDDAGRLAPSAVAATLDAVLDEWSCVAVGPGLGAERPQQQVVVRLLARCEGPLVIDADGLNALAAVPRFQEELGGRVILTPHPGEFRRLAAAVGIEADPIDPRGRSEAAAALAGRLGCIVVLKGAGTVVSDGLRTWVNQTGNAALATAGTGDVLTGVIAGLVAQFHREAVPRGAAAGGLSLFDCARLGTRLHGLAADRWAGRHGTAGLLVRDLLDELPDAMQQMRSDDRTP